MIEVLDMRNATEEEIRKYEKKCQELDQQTEEQKQAWKEEHPDPQSPEWQQRMMGNFLRRQEKKEVTRVMTIAQIQQMKKDMADLIADELLMKVVGIAALIIHDKFGMLMKKEVDGKSREERFVDEWEKQYKLFEAGRMTLEDIQEVLRDECGITMKREDAQHREWM